MTQMEIRLDDHARRLVYSLEDALDRYLTGALSLGQLQNQAEGIWSAFDSAVDSRVVSAIKLFVDTLEYTTFMFEEPAQAGEVQKGIDALRGTLRTICQKPKI